jgi:hypothetical protein
MNVNHVTIGGKLISHEICYYRRIFQNFFYTVSNARPIPETHSPELEDELLPPGAISSN